MIIRDVIGRDTKDLRKYLIKLPVGVELGLKNPSISVRVKIVFHTDVGDEPYVGCKFVSSYIPPRHSTVGTATVYREFVDGTPAIPMGFYHDGPGVFISAYQLYYADWYIASKKLLIQEYLTRDDVTIDTSILMGLEHD